MKRFVLFCFIGLCFVISSKAQNLIDNAGFDTYTLCPAASGDLANVTPWIKSIGSPDYFNSCFTNSFVSVPKNLLGYNYQVPRSNNAYVGISTINVTNTNDRENISSPLSTNLINGNYYIVKFYVAAAQAYKLASNNLALNFSSTLTTTVSIGSTVNLPMHIYKFGNPIIADTLNWTEIMGIYKANGTEQYITIGNFKDDNNTFIDTINNSMFTYVAYYMIDDVSVEPICTTFWSYRDTTVAIGDSVLIGPCITGLNINWYDATGTFITNAPGIYVKPNSPTFYTATEDFCGSIITHTINVGVSPVGINDISYLNEVVGVSPNPSNGLVTVTSRFDFEKIEVTNVTGQVMFSEIVNNKTYELQLQNYAEGIYFVKVLYANGMSVTKKIIKQ